MSNTKHTPGPWRHGFTMQNLNRMVRTDAGLICTLIKPSRYSGQDERYDDELKEAEANAKLIAAAPELLEALNQICELPQTIGHAYQMQDIAKAAIQKATT